MKRFIAFYVLCFLQVVQGGCKNEAPLLTRFDHPTYRAGQVWQYKTRPGEEASTFMVLAVEVHRTLGVIVHIRVSGVRVNEPGGRTPGEIGHMPISEAAINASVLRLVSAGAAPYEAPDEYYPWREAVLEGKPRVFTGTIAEAVASVESASHGTPGKA